MKKLTTILFILTAISCGAQTNKLTKADLKAIKSVVNDVDVKADYPRNIILVESNGIGTKFDAVHRLFFIVTKDSTGHFKVSDIRYRLEMAQGMNWLAIEHVKAFVGESLQDINHGDVSASFEFEMAGMLDPVKEFPGIEAWLNYVQNKREKTKLSYSVGGKLEYKSISPNDICPKIKAMKEAKQNILKL